MAYLFAGLTFLIVSIGGLLYCRPVDGQARPFVTARGADTWIAVAIALGIALGVGAIVSGVVSFIG